MAAGVADAVRSYLYTYHQVAAKTTIAATTNATPAPDVGLRVDHVTVAQRAGRQVPRQPRRQMRRRRDEVDDAEHEENDPEHAGDDDGRSGTSRHRRKDKRENLHSTSETRPSARGGTRTLTPRRAGGFKPPTSADYATRAGAATVGDDAAAGDRSGGRRLRARPPRAAAPTACNRLSRPARAASPVSPFATMTPSTMSASTSAVGRDRSTTATTGPPGSRRIVRGAPGRRGGDRNAGTVSPAARAAAPRRRASWAKRIEERRPSAVLNTEGETASTRGRAHDPRARLRR